jgi:hypothetical protein
MGILADVLVGSLVVSSRVVELFIIKVLLEPSVDILIVVVDVELVVEVEYSWLDLVEVSRVVSVPVAILDTEVN